MKDKDTLVYFFIEHYFQYGGSAFSTRDMTYYGNEFSYSRVNPSIMLPILEKIDFCHGITVDQMAKMLLCN